VPTVAPAVTRPVASTDATEGALLLQVPPDVASLSWLVSPVQALKTPVIGEGEFMVTVVDTAGVLVHPVPG